MLDFLEPPLFGKINFSPFVSYTIIFILVLIMVYFLLRTLAGKYIERRIVFLFVGLALSFPFFMQFTLPLQISSEVRSVYDALEELPPGSKVLAAFDYDPPSAPELQPMADAFLKYAFEKELKVIIIGLWPQGPDQAELAFQAAVPDSATREAMRGVDYVNLGFQAGNEFVILGMGKSFRQVFPADYRNTPYDSIPLVKNITNFSNIDFGINFSSGRPGTVEWVQIAVDRYELPLAAGNTAVQAPMAYPYLESDQLVGLLGGMSGGAEFETITDKPGKATTYLLSQSFAHAMVIAFIIIGNVAFFSGRRKK